MARPDTRTTKNERGRPWLYIGPGLVLALALSALIGSQWMGSRQQDAPPIVERNIVSSPLEKYGPTPEVEFIIQRREEIGLKDNQLVRLRTMDAEWKRVYGPKIAQANAAAAHAQEYLSRSQGKSRTPIAQIQSETASLTALSGEISGARTRYWSRAMNVLDNRQRGIVYDERKADWAARGLGREADSSLRSE